MGYAEGLVVASSSSDIKQKGKLASPEDALYVQKQCVNCRKFYREIDNNHEDGGGSSAQEQRKPICYYHRSNTCCTYLDLQSDDRNMIPEKQRGCIHSFYHIEDAGYSAIIAKFPVHSGTLQIMKQTHEKQRRGVGLAAPEDEQEEMQDENSAFIVHRVALTDTLMGISLYYNVKIPDIQRVNNLNSHQIFQKKTLIIPRPDTPFMKPPREAPAETEEQQRKRREKQIKLFCQMTSCDREEGKYYMEQCDYHIEQAMKEWKTDGEWAQNNQKQPINGSVKNVRAHKRNGMKSRSCC